MKKLHLHVKTEYFREIKAGIKKTEYRQVSAYWMKFFHWMPHAENGPKKYLYTGIVIYNAYRPGVHQQIHFKWSGVRLSRILHPHFGPRPVTVFAIDLIK